MGEDAPGLGERRRVLEYVADYDTTVVRPFDGVDELVAGLSRWSVCSNKHPVSGLAELERLGWRPELALFADAFDGAAKELGPILDRTGLRADAVLFVGDTAHDQRCALDVGCDFVWAGWNPRTAATQPTGALARTPAELAAMLAD